MLQVDPVKPSCPKLGVSVVQEQTWEPAALVPRPLQSAYGNGVLKELCLLARISVNALNSQYLSRHSAQRLDKTQQSTNTPTAPSWSIAMGQGSFRL